MSCSNCFNGCTEITSDQCVKYTGIDVPVLGIKTGDSLSYVEQALIEFLTSAIDGSGIKIDIPQNILCTLIKKYLPTCGDITATALFETLIQAVCDLQTQVTATVTDITTIKAQIAVIEGPYTIDCLTGVTSTSGTHAVVQALITKLCSFIINVGVTYVKIADIDSYIENYLTNAPTTETKPFTKMIPYAAVPYFGDIAGNFDSTGKGINNWINVNICNGQNGTPDLRGRVAVGVSDGTGGGGTFPASTDPNNSLADGLTPSYSKGIATGSNFITLSSQQLPSHNHNNTLTLVDPGHSTTITVGGAQNATWMKTGSGTGRPITSVETATWDSSGPTQTVTTQTTVKTGITSQLVNANAGGDKSHSNVQPGIGCYYIMYIP